jgi:hypothetical protein
MNCNDCCYNLPKDGHSYCTYEDGECVKISTLEKENAELEKENEKLKRGYHYEAEVINGKLTGKAILVPDSLAYAKSIVKDLLNNSDEYAKQRAREFLEENLK